MIWNRSYERQAKGFPWLWYIVALFVIVAFAFAPIGSVMLCSAIANTYGCKVDEGSVHPCIINGHDYGELLYSLGVMGWFMLLTIPGGVVAFVTWVMFLILHRVAWRKRVSAGIPPPIPSRALRHESRSRGAKNIESSKLEIVANRLWLTVTVFTAVARLAVIHRAIFARLFASRLIGRERAGANDRS